MVGEFRHDAISLKHGLLILLLCLCWGGLTPSLKLSLEGMPPLAIAGWRFLLGLLVIWFWCRLKGIEWRIPARKALPLFLFSLLFVAQISAINFATGLTLSNYAIVFLNTSPLWVALLAHWLIPGDRMSLRKVSGLLIAFGGIAAVFLSEPPGGPYLWGNVLALLSGFLLAMLQVSAKFLLVRFSAVQVVFWEIAFGVPCFFAASWWLESPVYNLDLVVVSSVIYQGVVIAGICFLSWVYLLQIYSASQLSAFQFSIPVFGVLLGWLLLGEAVTQRLIVGVVMVAVGIFLVSLERRLARPLGG